MKAKIETWVNEVRDYNRRLHLVSSSMEQTLPEQVNDTLALMEHIEEKDIGDLGSGSGFLGVPYKIANPEANVSLIERSAKKCLFLRHVIDLLGLTGIEVVEADPIKQRLLPKPALMSRSFSPRESLIQAVFSTLILPGRFYYFQTGDAEPVEHPAFEMEERFSKECAGYRLNLDVYLVICR